MFFGAYQNLGSSSIWYGEFPVCLFGEPNDMLATSSSVPRASHTRENKAWQANLSQKAKPIQGSHLPEARAQSQKRAGSDPAQGQGKVQVSL